MFLETYYFILDAYHLNLGSADYQEVWELQAKLHKYKQNKSFPDLILSVEHNHVYTLGKTGNRNHILISDEEMKSKGISYYEIDRGGDITYHGPGQLVVYPIFDLNNHYRDTHRFLRELEEAVILTLADYDINAHREEEYTGVWVGEEKICAIGIKVSKWITMHGLALNVNNDLSYFDKIVPCGIFHKGVTSIKKLTNEDADMRMITARIIGNFKKVFKLKEIEKIEIREMMTFIETT